MTSVSAGGFYGWPWFYIGNNVDPAHVSANLSGRPPVIVPVRHQSIPDEQQCGLKQCDDFPRLLLMPLLLPQCVSERGACCELSLKLGRSLGHRTCWSKLIRRP